jgi:hypothetical protein
MKFEVGGHTYITSFERGAVARVVRETMRPIPGKPGWSTPERKTIWRLGQPETRAVREVVALAMAAVGST